MFSDMLASIKIWMSNVTASVGFWINLSLILFIGAIILRVIIKSAIVKREKLRRSPLSDHEPDKTMTMRASSRLAGMLKFPTVTGSSDPLHLQCEYIKATYSQTLNRLGCLELPSGSMLLRWKARERTGDNPVLFCAHFDVVPAGEGWSKQPFSGTSVGDKIYGRGAIDNKSSIIAMLEAVEALSNEGFSPKRDIYFAFGHDEETGGELGAGQIAELLSRRNLFFDMIVDEGSCILENFMGKEDTAAALIGIGEKITCTYKVTVRAPGGDSSVPPPKSTIGMLSEAICRIEASQPRLRLLPPIREYLGKCFPAMTFGKRLAVSNIFLSKPFLTTIFRKDRATLALLRSTLTTTIVAGAGAENVIPTEVSATINARLLPGESAENMQKYIEGLISDLPVEVQLVKGGETVDLTQTDHPMYKLMCRTLDEKYDRIPCIPTLLTGGTDSKHYRHMTDCILRFSPFIMTSENYGTIHGPDEYITEKTLGLGIEFYKTLMKKL